MSREVIRYLKLLSEVISFRDVKQSLHAEEKRWRKVLSTRLIFTLVEAYSTALWVTLTDWLDRKSGFFATISSQHLKVETKLPTKVQRPLGFKAVLRLRFAVNEKSERRYTLLSTIIMASGNFTNY